MADQILLVGAGRMGKEFAKVLLDQNVDFITVGRGKANAEDFFQQIGREVIVGGLQAVPDDMIHSCNSAIVAVQEELSAQITIDLLNKGFKNILVEKPAGITEAEIMQIHVAAELQNANVVVAYNRRFYQSTLEARRLIQEDGGILSFHFEFTEWTHVIENIEMPDIVRKNYFLANSTHLVDLAYFLGGWPTELTSYHAGSLEWHPTASIFAGAGRTIHNAVFSYHANWESAGRFGLEILTPKRKLIFRPIEKLHIQNKGSLEVFLHESDYSLDENYKAGFYLQVENFVNKQFANMCTIHDHLRNMQFYKKIANY